jgi:hypothetical protein
MPLRIFARLHGGVRIARRVAEVAGIEQSEIPDRAVRSAPDFVSLNPGYACSTHPTGCRRNFAIRELTTILIIGTSYQAEFIVRVSIVT